MSIITNTIDGDTFETEEQRRVRLANVNTPESVHRDDSKNTEAGEKASEFTKDITSTGNVRTQHDYGVDHYGRQIGDVKKNINGTDIDLGLVLMDQGYSTYETRFGESKDPALHDSYKEYFAKNSPYQVGDFRQPMSQEDYGTVADAQKAFADTYSKFKDGDATQEEFDQATYNLYKDPSKVAHFRYMQAGWGKEVDAETMGNSDKESIMFAVQDQPELYNRAVRNSHLSIMKRPEQEKTFWENTKASFSQMNSLSNSIDAQKLNMARKNKKEYDIPKQQLTKGLDEKYHHVIMEEVDKYGEAAGLVLRDQLADDLENERVFDNMAWYAQIGYGAMAVIADPLTLVPAAGVAKGVQAADRATKMYQISKGIEGSRMWAQGAMFSNTSKAAVWATAGVVETGIQSFPRLSGDHTYTTRDYQLDLAMGGVFGTALGGTIETGKYVLAKREANKKVIRELDAHIENEKAPKYNSEPQQEAETAVVNAGNSQEQVNEWTGGQTQPDVLPDAQSQGKSLSEEKFTPWAAIDKVSTKGYQDAGRKIRNLFPKGSPMHVLINQQVGLNNKKLTPENTAVSHEINSEILHLASVYPDGQVPPLKMQEIKGIMFSQKDVRTVNVMDQILQGKSSNNKQLLGEYIEKLQGLKEFEGGVPAPKSYLDFANEFNDILAMENKADKDDLFTLTQGLPKEVSFIKDMLEMNVIARKNKDAEFTKQVEQLNGLVAARIRQVDAGAELKGKTRSFGKVAKISGPEIIARLKAEGLTPKTPEWKARFALLRKGEVPISKEVNEVGAISKRQGRTFKVEQDQSIDSVEMGAEKTHEVLTESEVDTVDLLPRDISKVDSVSAYKNPTVENLTKLRDKLRSVNKKNGSTVVTGKRESLQQRKRLSAISKRIKTNKAVTVQRMLDNGNMADLVDVIRVSNTLADENRLANAIVDVERPKAGPTMGDINAEIGSNIQKWETALLKAKKKLSGPNGVDDAGNHAELVKLNKALAEQRRVFDKTWKDVEYSKLSDKNKELFNDDLYYIRLNEEALVKVKARPTKAQQLANIERLEDELKHAMEEEGEIDLSKPITEEEIDTLHSPDVDSKLTPSEQVDIQTRVDAAVNKTVADQSSKIADGLAEFVRSGEKRRFELAAKPNGATDYVGRMLTKMTKGVGEIFIDSKLTSFKYFGSKVTEVGRGFGGKAKRAPTASIIRDAVQKESIVKVIPQYRKSIDAYANSKGKGMLGRLKARERSGETEPLIDQFNREVFLVQEYRRQGKAIPKSVDKSVTDFVDQWDYYMDHNHTTLVNANTAGFVAERKVKNYIPHIWQDGKFRGAITKYGRNKVEKLLAKGYMNLSTSKNPLTADAADAQAKKLIDDVLSDDFATVDQYSPTMDARAKQRSDIDTTTEIDGLSVMDLLDTDVVGLASKYSNRVGGWAGLAKATDGLISSQKDIDIFKANMIEEAKANNVKPDRYVQMFEDTIDQLFGRPTKNMILDSKGLPPELRELKDLAALTKMGGLGTAQLAETGQVITRSVLNTFSNPKVVKKVLAMGGGNKSERLLMDEIQSISNITNDLEFLDRQTVHLDQTTLHETSKVRQLSLKIANLATGGELKAEASRGLGKLSGYNMIRRAQTRVVQASFMLDIANHFTKGKGVMGNARMADVGLTDTLGKNDAMEAAFKKHAEFDKDGVLSKLNIDKWDKSLREELQYAMIRDEAQQIQRTHVGELPPWLNKPLMGLIFQFRQMPIVANSKSLGRALAFADKEAVTGVLLNTAIASIVRYSKFAVLGAATAAAVGEFGSDKEVTEEQTQVHKYISQLGIFPDLNDLTMGRNGISSIDDAESGWDFVKSNVPVMGLVNDYYEAGRNGAKGDMQGMVDSATNLIPLSNTAIGEVMEAALKPMIDKLPDGE